MITYENNKELTVSLIGAVDAGVKQLEADSNAFANE